MPSRATAAKARKRTEAQRNPKTGDEQKAEPILDNQEQENEIELLRKENSASNERAQRSLDIGVFINLVLTGLQFTSTLSRPNVHTLLALAQTFLLPLSFTPSRIPGLRPLQPHYTYVFIAQVLIASTALWSMLENEGLAVPALIRWFLPAIVAGSVFVQRRSESEAEVRLERLEGLRYDVKGA